MDVSTAPLSNLRSRNADRLLIGWAAWAAVMSVTWLLPVHASPWPTFYAEFWVVGSLLPVAVWLLFSRKTEWRADQLSIGFFVASLVPPLQAASDQFLFAGEAPLVSLYLLGIASTLVLGQTTEKAAPGRMINMLFVSLLIAGLISTGLAIAQWLSVNPIGAFLAPMPFQDRPVANVGQPNNLATMLVWGLIAVWRAYWKRHIGGVCAVLAAAVILIGVTLTQSRAGFLQVVLIAAVAVFWRNKLKTSEQFATWVGLLLWFLACYVMLDPLTRSWTEQVARPLLSMDSPRERLTLLQIDVAAIAAHPWSGYGWNQNTVAHVALAERFPMHGIVGNAHNFVLDLIIWNGLPVAILMTCGLGLWCWKTSRSLKEADDVLLALALATFGIHAMLELPHVLAYFLVPVALIAGTLNARVRATTQIRISSYFVGAMVMSWGVLLASLFTEYGRIETEEVDLAIQAAWPGTPQAPLSPPAVLLGALQDSLRTLRTEPYHGMSLESLAQFRRAVTRYPRRSGLFRYAEAAAINGNAKDARWALERLCALHPVQHCIAAASDWARLATERYPELAQVAVPSSSLP